MQASESGESIQDREVVIERVFDAPARILFEAHTKPEHIKRWFGPKGYPVTFCEMDFRKGGRFRFAMTGPDGVMNTPFGGEYREIEPNRRIVYDNGFELPDAGRMVVTLTFEEQNGRTKLTMRTVFDTVAMKNEHVGMGFMQGVGSGLDQLADLAAALGKGLA